MKYKITTKSYIENSSARTSAGSDKMPVATSSTPDFGNELVQAFVSSSTNLSINKLSI